MDYIYIIPQSTNFASISFIIVTPLWRINSIRAVFCLFVEQNCSARSAKDIVKFLTESLYFRA
jgi:hypothetical protein